MLKIAFFLGHFILLNWFFSWKCTGENPARSEQIVTKTDQIWTGNHQILTGNQTRSFICYFWLLYLNLDSSRSFKDTEPMEPLDLSCKGSEEDNSYCWTDLNSSIVVWFTPSQVKHGFTTEFGKSERLKVCKNAFTGVYAHFEGLDFPTKWKDHSLISN